jgi:hypothetical protein
LPRLSDLRRSGTGARHQVYDVGMPAGFGTE